MKNKPVSKEALEKVQNIKNYLECFKWGVCPICATGLKVTHLAGEHKNKYTCTNCGFNITIPADIKFNQF